MSGSGSANGPRLVRLTWQPDDARASVAFVGKGITYDSGGLTIKPGGSMSTMKYDMGGAAAVLAATFAIAELDLPVAVTTYAPMAENMVSGTAMRPGDVLTMYDGQTVEVTNTDAEGRLVLADGLSMAAEGGHDAIIDVATLTGPCVVALGEKVAGLFGDDETTAAIAAAAEVSGEMLWRLPIPDESREAVRTESKIADVLQHNWVRWGSALFAAAFLGEFVGDTPWAHLDIAGPAWNTGSAWGHVPPGCHRVRDPHAGGLRGRPRRRADRRTGPGRLVRVRRAVEVSAQLALLTFLLAAVVVAHPRRDAHQPRVVARHRVPVRELVRPAHRRNPPAGPLSVVRDEEQRHVGDGRPGLDEPLDTAACPDELEQVLLVLVVRGPGGATTTHATTVTTTAPETIEQTHAPSVLHGWSRHP